MNISELEKRRLPATSCSRKSSNSRVPLPTASGAASTWRARTWCCRASSTTRSGSSMPENHLRGVRYVVARGAFIGEYSSKTLCGIEVKVEYASNSATGIRVIHSDDVVIAICSPEKRQIRWPPSSWPKARGFRLRHMQRGRLFDSLATHSGTYIHSDRDRRNLHQSLYRTRSRNLK